MSFLMPSVQAEIKALDARRNNTVSGCCDSCMDAGCSMTAGKVTLIVGILLLVVGIILGYRMDALPIHASKTPFIIGMSLSFITGTVLLIHSLITWCMPAMNTR